MAGGEQIQPRAARNEVRADGISDSRKATLTVKVICF